jgi:ribosomal protein L35
MKTNKSLTKRLKVTKKGKVVARKPGHNHFNAKAPRTKQLAKKKGKSFDLSNKTKSHLLPFN